MVNVVTQEGRLVCQTWLYNELPIRTKALSQARNTRMCPELILYSKDEINTSFQGTYCFEAVVCIELGVPTVGRHCGPPRHLTHWVCDFIQFPGQVPRLALHYLFTSCITWGPLPSGFIHTNDNSDKQIVSLTTLLKHSLAQFYQLIGLCLTSEFWNTGYNDN